MEREKMIRPKERDGRDRRGRFTSGPGNKGKPPGAKHKYPTPKQLREELHATMHRLGGRHGTQGFLTTLGKKEPRAILNAAVRLDAADIGKTEPVEEDRVFRSVEECLSELDARGMSPALLRHHADLLEEFQTAKRGGKPYVYTSKPPSGHATNGHAANGQATNGSGNDHTDY
jgi:hypothetical protein